MRVCMTASHPLIGMCGPCARGRVNESGAGKPAGTVAIWFRGAGMWAASGSLRSGGIAGALKSSCDRIAAIGVVPVGVLGMKGGVNSGGVALSTDAAVMRSCGR